MVDREKFEKEGKQRLLSYQEALMRNMGERAERAVRDVEADDVFRNPVYREFLTQLDFSGLVEPFDYSAWLAQEGITIIGGKQERSDLIGHADLETLSKLVTAHMRIDRFVEGHLNQLMEEGFFVRVLERIREL